MGANIVRKCYQCKYVNQCKHNSRNVKCIDWKRTIKKVLKGLKKK